MSRRRASYSPREDAIKLIAKMSSQQLNNLNVVKEKLAENGIELDGRAVGKLRYARLKEMSPEEDNSDDSEVTSTSFMSDFKLVSKVISQIGIGRVKNVIDLIEKTIQLKK